MPPHSHALAVHVGIRPARTEDAALLLHWRHEDSVHRFQPLGRATLSSLRLELERQQSQSLYKGLGDKFQWIILLQEQPAGWITLVVTNWEHGLAEIGYALSTPFQGRGIMSLALEALLTEVFSQTSLHRLEARCAVGNSASQLVLERAGFVREGRLRSYFVLHGERVDNLLYAILRQDFLGLG